MINEIRERLSRADGITANISCYAGKVKILITPNDAFSAVNAYNLFCNASSDIKYLLAEVERLDAKQKPMQPIIRGLGQRYCPSCRNGNVTTTFCGYCGQRLEANHA